MESVRTRILIKLSVAVFLMLVFLGAILLRIFNLQYVEGEKYRKLAESTTVKNVIIPANRGNVYASDGNLLATSMSRFNILMDVMSVKDKVFERDIDALAQELSNLLGDSKQYHQDKLRGARKYHNRYLSIAKNIGYNDYAKMREFPIFKLGVYRGGFIAEQDTVRVHPIGKIAKRTIGYDDPKKGGAGIEGAFSDYLIGVDGSRLKQKIAKNQWKPINDVNEKEPIDGRDVITSIDVNVQDVTHHALLKRLKQFNAEHGCAVVMEVETGEIKAISNLGRGKNGRYYERLNYAVGESHEPGSTFKLASLMVALEDKVVDTSTVVDCGTGRYFVNNRKVEDSHFGGYGRISLARAFELSSNIGIVKTIQANYHKRPKKFIDRLAFFGIGKKTGVRIKGEGEPYIPNPKDTRWSPISLEWMSWGYGVSLTPLQTLMFYNAVANNGELVKPRFVKELRSGNQIEKSFGKVVLNKKIATQKTIKKVKRVMENVVRKGTAKDIFSPNFSMAGKTGTAKKWVPRHKGDDGRMVSGHYSNKRYVSSFVGFFPVDKPKYSCIVVIHDPDKDKGYYGAVVAGPVFKEIAHKIYTSTPASVESVYDSVKFARVDKDYQSYYKKVQKYKTIMPNVKGMSMMDAVSLLENMNLKVSFKGVGKVEEQSVKRGQKVSGGVEVYLK